MKRKTVNFHIRVENRPRPGNSSPHLISLSWSTAAHGYSDGHGVRKFTFTSLLNLPCVAAVVTTGELLHGNFLESKIR
jgi:hypothetical protein